MMRRGSGILLMLLLSAGTIHADLLTLDADESLSGSLVRVVENTLVFRTTLGGQIMTPMDTVKALTTERNLVVTLADGSVRYGRFQAGESGQTFVPLDGTAPSALELAQVVEAVVIPAALHHTDNTDIPAEDDLDVSLESGVRLRENNRQSLNALTGVTVQSPEGRAAASLTIGGDRTGDFPGIAAASAELRDGGEAGPGAYTTAGIEHDADLALDVRAQLALGLYQRLFSSQDSGLTGYAGIGAAYESWDAGPLEDRGVVVADGENARGDGFLHLRLRYFRAIFGGGALSGDIALYPSVVSPGDIRAQSAASVAWPLTQRLTLRFDVQLNYNSAPGLEDLDFWDTAVGAGFRWNF